MKFLDTNVFIRYLTGDDPQKAKNCEKLFMRIAAGQEEVSTSALVMAEVVWVLEKSYQFSKAQTAAVIQKILNTPHLDCENKDYLIAAAGLYAFKNIDFIDAYNAMLMSANHVKEIYSYDQDFDQIPQIHRLEP